MKQYTKAHLELLLDLMPYSVYLYDQSGEPIYSNRRGAEIMKSDIHIENGLAHSIRADYQSKQHILLANESTAGIVPVKIDGIEQYIQSYLAPITDEQGQMKYTCAIYIRIYNEQLIEKMLYPCCKNKAASTKNQVQNEQFERAQKVLEHILGHALAQYPYRILWQGEQEHLEGTISSAVHIPPRLVSLCRKMLQTNQKIITIMPECVLPPDQFWIENGIKGIGIYPLRIDGKLISTLMIGYNSSGYQAYKEQYQVLRICNQMEYYVKMLMLLNMLRQEIDMIVKIDKERQTFIEAEHQILCTTRWQGGFLEINKGFEKNLGYKLEELTNMKLGDFLQEVAYYEVSDQHVIVEQGRVRTPDGMDKWLSWDIVYKEVDGEPLMIAGARDVTDHVEEEKRYNEGMNRLEKEKNKSAVYATLSHELKTPLNIMLASCEMLRKNGGNEQKLVERIERRSYMMLKQVNDVIDLTKIGAGYFQTYPKKYNFVEVVESVIEVVAEYLGENGEYIVFDTMEEELIAIFDREVVERIVFNLIGNALDMAVAGTALQVTLTSTRETQIQIGFVAKPHFLKHGMEIPSIVDALLKLANMTLSWNKEGRMIGMCVTSQIPIIDYPYCTTHDETYVRNRQKCKIELAYLGQKREPKCS